MSPARSKASMIADHGPRPSEPSTLSGSTCGVRGDAADARVVAVAGDDRAGDVGPVPVVVGRVVVVIDEVPAAPVVDESVAVVVGPVHHLNWVRGELPREVGVIELDAGVDHGDGHASAGGAERPGLRDVHVGVGYPAAAGRCCAAPTGQSRADPDRARRRQPRPRRCASPSGRRDRCSTRRAPAPHGLMGRRQPRCRRAAGAARRQRPRPRARRLSRRRSGPRRGGRSAHRPGRPVPWRARRGEAGG